MDAINKAFFIWLILISSIVIADQNIPLDLNLVFDDGNVENILTREDWRESKPQGNNWREKQADNVNKHKWDNTSIYENNNQLDPIISEDNKPSGVTDAREASSLLKLRF